MLGGKLPDEGLRRQRGELRSVVLRWMSGHSPRPGVGRPDRREQHGGDERDDTARPKARRREQRPPGKHPSSPPKKDLLLRCSDPRPPHKTRRIPKTLDHYRGQVLGLVCHTGAGTHSVAVLMAKVWRNLALLQRAGEFHDGFAEMHDAKIGRAEMLAGAVGNRALAVLQRGVLLGDALDAGVAFGLLQLAIDQVVVRLV